MRRASPARIPVMAANRNSADGRRSSLDDDGSAPSHAGDLDAANDGAHRFTEHDPALIAAHDHAVLAAALDPIITIDAYGVIRSASDSVYRVFGWAPDELMKRDVNMLMPEPHRSAHEGYLVKHRRTGETNILGRTREFEAVRKCGDRFPIELSVSRVDVPGSDAPFFVGIIKDISERKRLEGELRLIQTLAVAIGAATSVAGAFVETIQIIADATGWDYGELWTANEADDSLAPAACWGRPGHDYRQFSEAGQRCRFVRGVGLPGRAWAEQRAVWFGDLSRLSDTEFCRLEEAREACLNAAAAVPVRADNETIGVLVFFVRRARREDRRMLDLVRSAIAPLGPLIRRKQVEEALAEHRLRLEETVEHRTHELMKSRERLRLVDRMASIGTLAAGLGHDMNNVLLPVRARLNALRVEHDRGALSEMAHAHIEAVRKSVSYLQQLADGLHYLAMNPDQDADERGSTDLVEWRDSVGSLLSKAVPKHVRVVWKFEPALPRVGVPAHGLTQAVLNLVVNAGEAIPGPPARKRKQGLVRIVAERATDDAGRGIVRIAVSDNGIGMTEDVKRCVFEMFYTTKARSMGTGLGLPLVHKVVDRAGGSIRVESEPGVGSTFTMTFPAVEPDGPASVCDGESKIALTMRDGRAAMLVRDLCESAGRAVVDVGNGPGDARVWIVDPNAVDARTAQSWRVRSPGGRLIVFVRPGQEHMDVWNSLDAHVIINNGEVDAVRALVAEALRADFPEATAR